MLARVLSISAIALLAVACKDSTSSGPPVVSKLSCVEAGGTVTQCTLALQEPGTFAVELLSTSCGARGNRVRITQPAAAAQVLTNDGCYEATPRTWQVTGSYPVGTAMALEVESARFQNDPVLRVTGSYPEWMIEFEDGADEDFDDLVMRVRAIVH